MVNHTSNDWSDQTTEVRLRHRRSLWQVLGGMPSAMLLALLGMWYADLSQFAGRYQLALFACMLLLLLLESRRMWHAEKRVVSRLARYAQMKSQLALETQLHHETVARLADGQSRVHLLDEVLPLRVLLVANDGTCLYHNRAFATWLNLRAVQIEGSHVREVMGESFFADMVYAYHKVRAGHHVRCEYVHTLRDGLRYRLVIQHIPYRDAAEQVLGMYLVLEEVSQDTHEAQARQTLCMRATLPHGIRLQHLYVDAMAAQLIGDQEDAARVMAAIEQGGFRLFSQEIRALQQDTASHHEMLIRLLDEEEYMMVPGAFFPLAERYGLMPHLDRWVVQHVIEWMATDHTGKAQNGVFFINLSIASMRDRRFVDFVGQLLAQHQVSGTRLCFEITDADLAAEHAVVVGFIHRVQIHGLRIALSSFGRNRVSFDPMEGFAVDFLKIDGSLVLESQRDSLALAKITAIQHVADELGVLTIAELVEQPDTIEQLKQLGVHYAQGFGIAQPLPLSPEIGTGEAA